MKPGIAAVVLMYPLLAPAGTGYKCVDANGAVSFQDRPCPVGARAEAFHYRTGATAPDAAAAAASTAEATATAPAMEAPAAALPARPAPEFYLCVRPDGERYYSEDGAGPPYAMPLGVLGYPPSGIDRAYGNRGRLGISASELSRPPVAAPGPRGDLAASYVMVQDDCRRLDADAACTALRGEVDTLQAKLRRSFQEDRPPLQARLRRLTERLSGCP